MSLLTVLLEIDFRCRLDFDHDSLASQLQGKRAADLAAYLHAAAKWRTKMSSSVLQTRRPASGPLSLNFDFGDFCAVWTFHANLKLPGVDTLEVLRNLEFSCHAIKKSYEVGSKLQRLARNRGNEGASFAPGCDGTSFASSRPRMVNSDSTHESLFLISFVLFVSSPSLF